MSRVVAPNPHFGSRRATIRDAADRASLLEFLKAETLVAMRTLDLSRNVTVAYSARRSELRPLFHRSDNAECDGTCPATGLSASLGVSARKPSRAANAKAKQIDFAARVC